MINIKQIIVVFSFATLCAMFTGCDGCSRESGSKPDSPVGKKETVTTNATPIVKPPAPVSRSLERKPLEPEATKRLADGPQEVTTTFQATGSGSWQTLGVKVSGKYFFNSYVKAISTIGKKEETARGNFEVTEVRKFTEVRDQLTVSDTDLGLALCETLPVEAVTQVASGIGAVLAIFNPIAGGSVVAGTKGTYEAIKSIDGMSLRGLCGKFGVKVPSDIEKWAQDMSNQYKDKKMEGIRNKIHSIEGKTYKIVYLQDKEGAPLRVDFTNVDGSPIEEDEWDILKLANVFIDAEVIPDKRVQPGDKWEVDANTIAGLVDPVAQGGQCEGKISIERKDDLAGGDWKLQIHPSKVTTKSSGGATAGVFRITDGNAVGDAKNAYVKSIQVIGTGRLGKSKSNRWAIFDFMTRIDGECEFRAFMTSNRTK